MRLTTMKLIEKLIAILVIGLVIAKILADVKLETEEPKVLGVCI